MNSQNQTYNTVPNIISGKDLDYLSDMFEWNHNAFKKAHHSSVNVQDTDIKEILERTANLFHSNMTIILNILNEGGQNEQQSN